MRASYRCLGKSPDSSVWSGNFRDLSASITRLATLADNGRIGKALVDAEKARLRWQWLGFSQITLQTPPSSQRSNTTGTPLHELLGDAYDTLDYFNRLQLQAVVTTCQACSSLSEAGRTLFDVSRTKRDVINDADRLRKYLLKFGLSWEKIAI
jgi:transcriptional regulatory protein RtcR